MDERLVFGHLRGLPSGLLQGRRHRSGDCLYAGQSGEHRGAERRRRLQRRSDRRHRRRRARAADEGLALHCGPSAAISHEQKRDQRAAPARGGGTATLLANEALKHFALEPGRDVSVLPMAGSAASRYAVLESGLVDASLLSVPENIIAVERGFNELIFLGDIVEFPQNGFGTSEKQIRENPGQVYRMVRATLRGLQFIWDKNNREAVIDILMKQWKLGNRKMAGEMLRHLGRVLTTDAWVKPESVRVLIDLQRENAKVTRPVAVTDVVDYSFVDKARKELGLAR
ncbi:MAG: ABC transporter substrate-binding protein [Deltaproteobacteria bacterium]|nr:ABC transporter substrate-binding protein [Deltaproteobacteria bacterium]